MSEPNDPVTLAQVLTDVLGRELTAEEIADLEKPYVCPADMPPRPSHRWPPLMRKFHFPEDGQEDFPINEDK